MKKKKICIFLCMLLITALLPSAVTVGDEEDPEIVDECGCKSYNKMSDNYRENLFISYPVMSNPIHVDFLDDEPCLKPTIVDTPHEFSWKNYEGRDWTTPAKDQADPVYCGCCWDFSAIGTLESVINIREGCAELDPDLSEQYVLSCLPDAANTPGEGCSGGNSYKAFLYMMNTSSEGNYHNGALLESCFPYYANDDVPCSDKCENWENYLVPILNCEEIILPGVLFNDPEAIEAIKSQIMIHGPLASYMNVTDHFILWVKIHHKPTDYYPYVEEEWANWLNHVISIVGWKDDPSIGNGGYWICKNSWGTKSGYEGFFNIEYGCLFTGVVFVWVDYDPDSFDWPPIPPTINGPSGGKTGEEYEYTFATMDPDGDDDVYYYIDWGDGTQSDWLGPYESGEEMSASHSWSERGRYEVRVKAKDINGAESDWSDPLPVSMPKTYENPLWTLIEKLFDWLEQMFGREILPEIFNY